MAGLMVFRITEADLNVNDLKCGCCNWRVNRLWVLASSRDEAIKLVRDGEGGLCAECMLELLEESGGKILIE